MPIKKGRIQAKELYQHFDLSIQIINTSDVNEEIFAAMFCGIPINTKLPSLSNFEKINETLYSSANTLVTQIRDGIKRRDLPLALINPQDGLASNGYLAQNFVFSQEVNEHLRKHLNKRKITLIEINSDYFVIPWEWLFDSHPQLYGNKRKLFQVMKPFWGCRRVITRRKLKNTIFGARITTKSLSKPIRIGLIIDYSLEYAKRERDWFYEISDGKTVEIHEFECKVKSRTNEWDFINAMNKFLNREDIDIFHFACDSDAKPGDSLNSSLQVCDNHKYLLKYLQSDPKVNFRSALIFLNACSTGVRNPKHTYNYVDQFIERGAGTVIAIESSIHSQVAMNFAQLFYQRLLSGMDVGNSLVKARIDILQKGRSSADVVSLFYSLYGDPFLNIPSVSPNV